MSKKSATVTPSVRELNDLYYELSNAILSCEDRGYHKVESDLYFRKHHKNLLSLKDKVGTTLNKLVMKS